MYRPKEEALDLDYLVRFFKTPQGKSLLGLASPGGAGRNKTLGQEAFLDLSIPLPPYPEQRKIAAILRAWDEAIAAYRQGRIDEAEYLRRATQAVEALRTGRDDASTAGLSLARDSSSHLPRPFVILLRIVTSSPSLQRMHIAKLLGTFRMPRAVESVLQFAKLIVI